MTARNDLILVTAATGKIGSNVVAQLLEAGATVRAFVRAGGDQSALQSMNVDIAEGDLWDIATVRHALDGVDRAFFCCPPGDGLLEASTIFAIAAKELKLQSGVNISQIIARQDHPSPLSRQHWQAEHVLDWSGVPFVHLRPTLFMNNLLMFNAASIQAADSFFYAYDDACHAPIAAADIARSAVAVLRQDNNEHAGKRLILTGRDRVSQHDVAMVLSDVLDRTITYQPMGSDEFLDLARQHSERSEFMWRHLETLSESMRQGEFDLITDSVKDLTGHEPIGLRAFVETHRAAFEPS